MAARRGPGTRAETIHCEYCGEDYAVTYRRCPFCDGRPPAEDGEDSGAGRRFGRRLAGDSGREANTRGGGYGGAPSPLRIIGTVLSLALIVAAVCIVISIIKPLIDKGSVSLPDSPDKTVVQPTPTPAPTPGSAPAGAGDPTAAPTPDAAATPMVPGVSITLPAVPTPAPTPTPVPAGTATGFSLSKTDFTINDRYPNPVTLQAVFVPAGATGTLTWSSSNTEVATVDANGTVTPGTKSGTATITATLEGVGTQTCTVRCTFSGSAPSSSGNSGSSSGSSSASLSLNREDFTLGHAGETFTMRVSGTSSTPSWSIGNSSVATIGSDGKVTAVAEGKTTVTCTVDGRTLECIVRCRWE